MTLLNVTGYVASKGVEHAASICDKVARTAISFRAVVSEAGAVREKWKP